MVEKVLQINREKYIFWTLIGILFVCAGFYIFCINTTVRNVVTRQKLENQTGQLILKIGNSEFQYIALKNKITLPIAYSLGFRDVLEKTFVSRESVSKVAYIPSQI